MFFVLSGFRSDARYHVDSLGTTAVTVIPVLGEGQPRDSSGSWRQLFRQQDARQNGTASLVPIRGPIRDPAQLRRERRELGDSAPRTR